MEIAQCDVSVSDPTDAAAARRAVLALLRSRQARVDENATSIVVTEGCSNLVKHAGGGVMLAQWAEATPERLWLLFLDSGPGIANISAALQDGYSTAASCGNGLGAIRRQSCAMELFSLPDYGTALLAAVGSGTRTPPGSPAAAVNPGGLDIGGWAIPYPDQPVCGDGWCAIHDGDLTTLVVSDGLGHGVHAAAATARVMETVHEAGPGDPESLVARIHRAVIDTRGAAVAAVTWNRREQTISHCGIGNISATLLDAQSSKQFFTQNGTAGYRMTRLRTETHPWHRGSRLVVASDGVDSGVRGRQLPRLWDYPSLLISGMLWQRYKRGRDDATVVVVRDRGGGNL